MSSESISMNDVLENTTEAVPPAYWTIPLEWVAYLALIGLALVLRLADIDIVPLSDAEARQALAAWHVVQPQAPGNAPLATSPLMFWGQVISFTVLGAHEASARLPGLIGSIVLLLLPLLFRARIGRDVAFLWSVILTFAPISLITARTGDAVIGTAIMILLLLWAVGRYADQRQPAISLFIGVMLAGLLFLTEASGVLVVITLLLAVALALAWSAWSMPQDLVLEMPGQNRLAQGQALLAQLPWGRISLVGLVAVIVISTGWLVYPAGLGMVSELLAEFLRGLTQPYTPAAPPAYPVLALALYDPLLLLLGLVAVFTLMQQERFGLQERFLAAWFVVGVLVLILYRGAAPGAALWLMLPLTLLVAQWAAKLFENRRVILFFFDDLLEDAGSPERYGYVKYLLGLIVVALLVMLTIHAQELGRALLTVPTATVGEVINVLLEPMYATFRYSLIWFVIALLFITVSFFMAASIWGNSITLQGFGLGVFAFMLVSGMGGGFGATGPRYTQPGEFWQTAAVTRDAQLLRTTLIEVTQRTGRGFPLLNVVVVRDEARGIADDTVLNWLLRDFVNTTYTANAGDAQGAEVILLAASDAPSNLTGVYVGQSFALRTHWAMNNLRVLDVPAWFFQRALRADEYLQDAVVLWLRGDVYAASETARVAQ